MSQTTSNCTHDVERTTLKGEDFRGTCVNCGKINTTIKEVMQTPCANPPKRTIVEFILGDKGLES